MSVLIRGRSGKVNLRDLPYNFLLCMKLEDTTIDMFNCFAVPNNMSKISIYLSTGAH